MRTLPLCTCKCRLISSSSARAASSATAAFSSTSSEPFANTERTTQPTAARVAAATLSVGSSSQNHRSRARRRIGSSTSALSLAVAVSMLSAISETAATVITSAGERGTLDAAYPAERQEAPASQSGHFQYTSNDILSTGSVSISLVRTGLMYVILYSTLASLLFVLASVVALKHGIAAHRRRLPTAWVVGLAMVLGLVGSILNTVFWALMLANELTNRAKSANFWVATSAMLFITPLVAHIALILRLSDLHPPTLASTRKRALVIAFPVVVTIVRVAAIITYHVQGHAGVRKDGFLSETQSVSVGKYALVEQVAALVQLVYITVVLSYKFHQLGKGQSSSKDFMHDDEERWTLRNLFKRIQQALYATAFSFAFPTLYQVGVVACRASKAVSGNDIGYILVANVYVQVLGAVLATLSSSHRWREDRFAGTYEPGESIVRRSSKGETDSGIMQARATSTMRQFRHVSTCGCDCASLSANAVPLGNATARRHSGRQGDDVLDLEECVEMVTSNHSDVCIDSPDAYMRRNAGRRPKTSDSDATRSCNDTDKYLANEWKDSNEKAPRTQSLNPSSLKRHLDRPGTGDSSSARSESENYAAPTSLGALDPSEEKRRSSDITLFPSYANTPWVLPGTMTLSVSGDRSDGDPSSPSPASAARPAADASPHDSAMQSPRSGAFPQP